MRLGFHGIRPLCEVMEDQGRWFAFCHWCGEHDQESIVAGDLPGKRQARAAADGHEYRHAGCDPQHVLLLLRGHGGEMTTGELKTAMFRQATHGYAYWLLNSMAKRGLIERCYRGSTRYYRLTAEGDDRDAR